MTEEVIRTDYLDRLMSYRDNDLIKVMTGMRRAGKSILMRQFRTALENAGIPKDRIVYIDMDSVANDRYRDGLALYRDITAREAAGRQYILIDEVQNIGEWVRIVESLRNDIDCDIYLTGSNAYMLSSDISTTLTGRSVTITVLPLSFRESMILHGETDTRTAFLRYLRHGGMPVLRPGYSEEVSFQMIDELKSDIILKDISRRKPGTDPEKIRRVIDYLYSEVGNPISAARISKELKMSSTTASEYLQLITDSMLFMKAERYDLKGRTVLAQEPKYYCTDTGMRYSQPISERRDFGKTLEAMVYLELIRRGYRVYVGKTGGRDMGDKHLEIDFIVMKGETTDYYQVTESLNDPEVYEREFRPLRKITGRGERYVITYDDVPVFKGREAIVMNIRDFLTGNGEMDSDRMYPIDAYGTSYDMLASYLGVCTRIHGTVVTADNFDRLTAELQKGFFDLQAYYRRPELIKDRFIQDRLSEIRMNNVRIFDSMIGCVNANMKEPKYHPVMTDQLMELTRIKDDLSLYVADRISDRFSERRKSSAEGISIFVRPRVRAGPDQGDGTSVPELPSSLFSCGFPPIAGIHSFLMKLPRVILLLPLPPPTVTPDWTVSVSLIPRAFSIFLMILSSGTKELDSIFASVPFFSRIDAANCSRSIPLAIRASFMTPP